MLSCFCCWFLKFLKELRTHQILIIITMNRIHRSANFPKSTNTKSHCVSYKRAGAELSQSSFISNFLIFHFHSLTQISKNTHTHNLSAWNSAWSCWPLWVNKNGKLPNLCCFLICSLFFCQVVLAKGQQIFSDGVESCYDDDGATMTCPEDSMFCYVSKVNVPYFVWH